MSRHLLILIIVPVILLVGCTSKSKRERHVQRADAFYESGEEEKARIEYMNAFQLDQNDAHVASRLAEAYMKSGDVESAFTLYAHTVSLQPTNNDIRVKLATILLLGGQAERARAEAAEVLKSSPLHPDALLIYANSSVGTNQVTEARARFDALAAANPNAIPVHLGLGNLAQRSGAPEAAETSFKKAVSLDPKSPKAHFALGTFYFQRGDTTNAAVHLKSAMELSPVKSLERLGYAELLVKTGQGEAAQAVLLEATTAHPEFTAAWNALTQLAFLQNNTNKATEYIGKVLAVSPRDRDALLNQARLKLASRDFKSALGDLENLSKKHPKDSEVLLQTAVAQLATDNANQAFTTVNNAIAANTNNVDAYILRARLQMMRNDLNSAISDLRMLTRRFPNTLQAYFLLGSAYRMRGNLDEAAAVYTTITKGAPQNAQGFQLLGVTLRQQDKISEARTTFENALKVNPDYLAAIDSLTDLDIEARQYDAAIRRIEHYIEKYPKSPLPPLLLGKVLFKQQKNDEAEVAVQKAISLEPEFMPAHRALADFYVQTRQLDKATAKYEAIVASDGKDVGSMLQLGMLYDAKGEYPKAVATYQALIQVNPNMFRALNNLAYTLSEHMGEVDRAVQYARRARDLAPTDPYIADTFGWILWKKGQYPEALAAVQQSLTDLSELPEVQYHLGMAQYMMGDTSSAAVALTRATQSTNDFVGKDLARNALAILKIDPAQKTPENIALVERHLAQHPNDIFAHVQLARLHEANGDWTKALAAYEKALAANPNSLLVLSSVAALHAGGLNQPDRAIEYVRRIWNSSPTPAVAAVVGPIAFNAGDIRWANGRLNEALRAQTSPELLYYKALASYALGAVAQARENLARITQSNGLDSRKANLARAALEMTQFQLGQGSVEDAQRAVQASLAIEPRFIPALVTSGVIAERKGDFHGARTAYETALQLRPELVIAKRQLAILYGEKLADDAKAQQLATAVRSDLPDDQALTRVLGKIAYRKADYQEAARLLNSVASSDPKDSDLLYHLGMAQYYGKVQGAKANLTRAIALEPNGSLAADAKKALAELK